MKYNNTKKLIFFITSFVILLTVSCGKDEPFGPLEGKIDNIDYELGSSIFEESNNDDLLFELGSADFLSVNPCAELFQGIRIFFTAKDNLEKQELFFDFQNFEGFTVTLFNPSGANNIIVTDGYFQILERSGTKIKAELDIKADNESFVKGEFTADFCD